MKKALFITTQYPYPSNSGGKIVTREHFEFVCKQYHTTLISKFEVGTSVNLKKDQYLFPHWINTSQHPLKAVIVAIKAIWQRLPYKVLKHDNKNLNKLVLNLLSSEHYDIIVFDQLPALSPTLLKSCPLDKTILLSHNNEAHTLDGLIANAKNQLKQTLLKIEKNNLYNYERAVYSKIKKTLFLSELDLKYFQNATTSCYHFPIHHAICKRQTLKRTEFPAVKTILIVGTFSWTYNAEGLMWFVENVLPHLPTDINIDVVGTGLGSAQQNRIKKLENINYHGYQENIELFYNACSLVAIPVFNGSGVKIKMVDSVFKNIPTVITQHVADGDPELAGYCHITNDPKEFASVCIKICNSAAPQDHLSHFIANFNASTYPQLLNTYKNA